MGLAWLASGARPGTRLVSVERGATRAHRAATLFSEVPQVTISHADWHAIYPLGPFDPLVLDGGSQRKGGGAAANPALLVRPGGIVVIDDLTPARHWPPQFEGQVDEVRTHWLSHPGFDAAELRLAPDLATLLATRRFPAEKAQD